MDFYKPFILVMRVLNTLPSLLLCFWHNYKKHMYFDSKLNSSLIGTVSTHLQKNSGFLYTIVYLILRLKFFKEIFIFVTIYFYF